MQIEPVQGKVGGRECKNVLARSRSRLVTPQAGSSRGSADYSAPGQRRQTARERRRPVNGRRRSAAARVTAIPEPGPRSSRAANSLDPRRKYRTSANGFPSTGSRLASSERVYPRALLHSLLGRERPHVQRLDAAQRPPANFLSMDCAVISDRCIR